MHLSSAAADITSKGSPEKLSFFLTHTFQVARAVFFWCVLSSPDAGENVSSAGEKQF